MDFQIWQIADSAFPLGGFAHSAGLEAALQQGEIQNLEELQVFIESNLWQAGYASFPLLNSAFRSRDLLIELDLLCDVFLSNHVANRASRVQGRAFFSACQRSFAPFSLVPLEELMNQHKLLRHYAPVFGATLSALEIDLRNTQSLFLHLTLRGLLSAAVRLGILGPYQSQKMQFDLKTLLEKIILHCGGFESDRLAQTAPLTDLFQTNHDRLYSRLFQS